MPDEQTTTPQRPKPRLAGILWGNAKVGKTTLAASSPGHKFIINHDPEGWVSVANRTDITVWDYSDGTPASVLDVMTNKIGTKIDQSDMKDGDTCIFDSCTTYSQLALSMAITNGIGASSKFSPSIDAPGLAAYGSRTQRMIACMTQVIRATRRKGAHIWFICHEDTADRDDKGNLIALSILLSENAINQASAAISEIWWIRESNNARHVAIRPTLLHKPMGTRMFRTDEAVDFKLRYDPEKPDLDQPMSIASMWKRFEDGGYQKLNVPEDKSSR